jgi:RNA polymerase sigma factor (sigma-70 family)
MNYYDIAKIVVDKHFNTYKDKQELYLVANEAVFVALKKYDNRKSCKLTSYINIYVRWMILNYLKKEQKQVVAFKRAKKILNVCHYDKYEFIDKSILDYEIPKLLPKLPPRKREILEMLYNGLSIDEIKQILGVKRHAVTQHILQIKNNLEKYKKNDKKSVQID